MESIWRRKINATWKSVIIFGMGRIHGGKRRKCWLPAFSTFPTVFSKGFFFRVAKKWDCVVELSILSKEGITNEYLYAKVKD